MTLEDIKKLAILARIDMSDEEMEGMAKDFDPILEYVGHIQEVSKLGLEGDSSLPNSEDYRLHNIMRDDIATNKSGEYTEKILKEVPDTLDGFVKVKQIL